jgi:hypothetical protein
VSIEAEIYAISHLLPINDRYLAFNCHSDVGEYPHESYRVAGPKNLGVAVGISLLSYIQAEILHIAYVLPANRSHV